MLRSTCELTNFNRKFYCFVIGLQLYFRTLLQSIADSAIGEYATPSVVISMMASAISVMAIIVLNFFYDILARKLTEIELPRTQQQFDDSFSFKVFCFQFVNYNSTLFYIAFFKDTLTGYPGNPTTIELDGTKYRWAGCDGGCSYELAFQLIFTMVARQTYQNVFEVYLPWIIQKYKKWSIVRHTLKKIYYQNKLREKKFKKRMEDSPDGNSTTSYSRPKMITRMKSSTVSILWGTRKKAVQFQFYQTRSLQTISSWLFSLASRQCSPPPSLWRLSSRF